MIVLAPAGSPEATSGVPPTWSSPLHSGFVSPQSAQPPGALPVIVGGTNDRWMRETSAPSVTVLAPETATHTLGAEPELAHSIAAYRAYLDYHRQKVEFDLRRGEKSAIQVSTELAQANDRFYRYLLESVFGNFLAERGIAVVMVGGSGQMTSVTVRSDPDFIFVARSADSFEDKDGTPAVTLHSPDGTSESNASGKDPSIFEWPKSRGGIKYPAEEVNFAFCIGTRILEDTLSSLGIKWNERRRLVSDLPELLSAGLAQTGPGGFVDRARTSPLFVASTLVDRRFLLGSNAVWEEFSAGIDQHLPPRKYAAMLVEQTRGSHAEPRHEDVIGLQTKCVKSGRGGYRNLQYTRHLGLCLGEPDKFRDPAHYGTDAQARELAEQADFVRRMRHALAITASSKADDNQVYVVSDSRLQEVADYFPPAITAKVGFGEAPYCRTNPVARIRSALLSSVRGVDGALSAAKFRATKSFMLDGPDEKPSALALGVREHAYAALREPVSTSQLALAYLTVFRSLQETLRSQEPGKQNLALSSRDEELLWDLAAQSWRFYELPPGSAAEQREAADLFRTILGERGFVAPIVRLMSETRFLAWAAPATTHMRGISVPGGAHKFDVQDHTFAALEFLDAILGGNFAKHEALGPLNDQADLLQFSGDPAALAYALLHHDCARKFEEKRDEHADLGARIARECAPGVGFDEANTALIGDLVLRHPRLPRLALSQTRLTPADVDSLLQGIPSLDILKLHLIHALSDKVGTNPDRWATRHTRWLLDVYQECRRRFAPDDVRVEVEDRKIDRVMAALTADPELRNLPRRDVLSHFAALPDDYLPAHELPEILGHLRLQQRLAKSGAPGASLLLFEPDQAGIDLPEVDSTGRVRIVKLYPGTVLVVATDAPGLFAKMTSGLTPYSIADALAYTRNPIKRGPALACDTFRIYAHSDLQESNQAALVEGVDAAVAAPQSAAEALRAQLKALRERTGAASLPNLGNRSRIEIVPLGNSGETEVRLRIPIACDRPGLLCRLSDRLSTSGLEIVGVRAGTLANYEVLSDIFRVSGKPSSWDDLHRGLLEELV